MPLPLQVGNAKLGRKPGYHAGQERERREHYTFSAFSSHSAVLGLASLNCFHSLSEISRGSLPNICSILREAAFTNSRLTERAAKTEPATANRPSTKSSPVRLFRPCSSKRPAKKPAPPAAVVFTILLTMPHLSSLALFIALAMYSSFCLRRLSSSRISARSLDSTLALFPKKRLYKKAILMPRTMPTAVPKTR